MENPKKDPLFSITDSIPIVKHTSDGSWFTNNSQTRMNVITPHGYTQWKNIELTGYFKAIPIINQTTTSLFNNNVNNIPININIQTALLSSVYFNNAYS